METLATQVSLTLTVYATVLMIVEAAFSETTPYLSQKISLAETLSSVTINSSILKNPQFGRDSGCCYSYCDNLIGGNCNGYDVDNNKCLFCFPLCAI